MRPVIHIDIGGDPLSPSWPSVPGAYRQKYNETEGLPRIPSQPIGYGDAKKLLEVMGGEEVSVIAREGPTRSGRATGPRKK